MCPSKESVGQLWIYNDKLSQISDNRFHCCIKCSWVKIDGSCGNGKYICGNIYPRNLTIPIIL